ncbi:MAG: hypothetical protein J1F03_08350, partial [Oscillospiraceae bacterium]|nr:hypothetical protein [Oscillospiraceae bacterium]
TDVPDKKYPTTPIYRVSFRANDASLLPPDGFMAFYVDPGENVPPPQELPRDAAWYVKDSNGGYAEYDGTNIQCDLDAVAGRRILFAGEDGTIEHRITYSTEEQTVDLDLYMKYAEGGPYSEGRFEYTLIEDTNGLNAQISDDLKTLVIPAGMSVTENGYTLKFRVHEKEPFIMPLELGPFGTDDVYLTVHIMIEKATPEIIEKPTADEIDYGTALSGSTLGGGTAVHPTARTVVDGAFKWNDADIVPNVNEAAITGCYVVFEPVDTDNYNTVIITVTLTVNKVAPTNVTPPTKKDSIYNGMAEDLITGGSAVGGTMKYWLSDDPNANPPADNSEYSSTIPARANAATYTIWYKVIGDENHKDTEPNSVTATISPYPLEIKKSVTYNGGDTFTLALEGVKADGAVIAYVKTSGKNAGSYGYPAANSDGIFTVELSNSNYVVDEAKVNTLDIERLPVVLKWKGPLTFVEDNNQHSVKAEVTNGIEGDTLDLKYEDNSGSAAKGYTAKVTDTGNPNYTADPDKGAQNITQPWRIFEDSKNITLTANPNCTTEAAAITYGAELTLTAEISMLETVWNKVQFYVNNEAVGPQVDIKQIGGKNTATYTISDATAQNYFSLGANVVRIDYKTGNSDGDEQVHAITVFVKPKPINAKFNNTEKVYDGNDVAAGLVIEIEPQDIEGTDEVKITADNYTYNSANAADAKTITAHNVTLIGAQSGNYTIDSELKTTGKITPKTVKPEWRGVTGLVYNGSPANVNATATDLLPDDKCEITVTDGNKINAGRYTAEAVSVDNTNYQLPNDNTVFQDYEIKQADLYIEDQERPYNGTNKFSVRVDDADGRKVAVELTASGKDAGSYTYSTDSAEANAYTASTNDTNYNIAGGGILTILKADPNCKAPVPLELPYTGLPQELVIRGTADGGEVQYSLTKDGTYYTDVPTGIELGTYTVWYKVLGDNNHNDIEPQSVEALISDDIHDDPEDGGTHTPNYPNVSDSDTSDSPSDPASSDSDTTNKPDNSQDHNGVPNTGVEINYAFFFMLMCLCGTVISIIVRKVR